MSKKELDVRRLVMIGLFISLQIIFTRFMSIETPTLRFGFGYLPMAVCSMMFGPLVGGITAAIADVLRVLIFPTGAAFFPGFTVTAFLSGAAYGLFTKKIGVKLISVTLGVLVVCLFLNLVMDTYWLKIMLGKGYLALLFGRVVKCVVMIPVQISTILATWRLVRGYRSSYSQ